MHEECGKEGVWERGRMRRVRKGRVKEGSYEKSHCWKIACFLPTTKEIHCVDTVLSIHPQDTGNEGIYLWRWL